MLEVKTKTLSARVPAALADEFGNWCKAHNTTVSEQIQSLFNRVKMPADKDMIVVDKQTNDWLFTLAGGSAVAVLVYKAIVSVLTDKYPMMSIEDIKLYALGGAVMTGILGGVGINQLLK